MAASPPTSSSAIPGSPAPPPASQSNATTDPPTTLTPSQPSSPPLVSAAPPPSLPSPPPATPSSPPPTSLPPATPASPPPTSPPPATPASPPPTSPPPATPASPPPTSPPPATPASPPPTSPPLATPVSPPPAPVVASPPPTSNNAPQSAFPTLPPPAVSSPLPPAPPPAPPLSTPLSVSPPPTSFPSAPPPSLPTTSPPSVIIPPPSPAKSESPPPAPSETPPESPSQPPPTANPPSGSPLRPVSQTPPGSDHQNPHSKPSAPPPPKYQPPPAHSPPSPLPSNSSSGPTSSSPSVSSPPTNSFPPPLPSPTTPSGNLLTPAVPGSYRSSNFSSNATRRPGGSTSGGGSGIKPGTVVPIVVAVSLLVLCLVGTAVWVVKKKRRKQVGGYTAGFVMPSPFSPSQVSESSYPRSPSNIHSAGSHVFINSPPNPGLGNSKLLFTYEQLYKITNGFSANNLLGEGGFGCVYKGTLADGREVAVKQLKIGGGQGEREFAAEVETISRVHHRHLVSLAGYCIAQNQRLLVYDFVPNNTLHYHLHENGRTVMDWATRVKVAAGAARGIAYLHEDCHPRIIHRDIKSSNILLDNNFDAQVSDFGLAKLAIGAATHVTTRVMGTFGYMAPEYASTGKLTDRSDVYSFGVVLLELITGRKPVDQSQPLEDESLVEWARPLLTHALDTGEFEGLTDHRLERNYNEAEMFHMIEAAAACVRHSASMRPKMGLVVRALGSLADSDLNNGVMPGRSELFTAPQSTELRILQRMAFGSQDYSIDFSRSSMTSRNES